MLECPRRGGRGGKGVEESKAPRVGGGGRMSYVDWVGLG